jgi:hypothetical protein
MKTIPEIQAEIERCRRKLFVLRFLPFRFAAKTKVQSRLDALRWVLSAE